MINPLFFSADMYVHSDDKDMTTYFYHQLRKIKSGKIHEVTTEKLN